MLKFSEAPRGAPKSNSTASGCTQYFETAQISANQTVDSTTMTVADGFLETSAALCNSC